MAVGDTTLAIATPTYLGFFMAVVRTTAWMTISPPFAGRNIPTVAKVVVACALALPVTPNFAAHAPGLDFGDIAVAIIGQIVAGLALGVLVMILFSAVSAAGQLIDLFGGFTLDAAYDPLSQNQSGPFGRANQLLATTLLFATGGYLILIHGLLSTYQAIPLGGPDRGMLGDTLTKAFSKFFLGAVEVAAPLLAVLILADIALALLSRAAPALNVFSLSFPVKILVTLLLIGVSLPLLPGVVEGFVGDAIHAGQHTGLVGQ